MRACVRVCVCVWCVRLILNAHDLLEYKRVTAVVKQVFLPLEFERVVINNHHPLLIL